MSQEQPDSAPDVQLRALLETLARTASEAQMMSPPPSAHASAPVHPHARASYEQDRKIYLEWRDQTKNPKARQLFAACRPDLSPVQLHVLQEMQSRGTATITFEDMFGRDNPMWDRLCRLALEFHQSKYVRESRTKYLDALEKAPVENKDYVVRYRPMKEGVLSLRDPMVELALCPEILDLANAYLELWSKLIVVDMWYTIASPIPRKRASAQNWHRDRIDERCFKLFLYFNNIDERSGATEIIPGSKVGGPYERLCPPIIGTCTPQQAYPDSQMIDATVPERDVVKAVGSIGTMFFCDTALLHRGGLATHGERLFGYLTYVTPASLCSRREFEIPESERAILPTLRESARFALDTADTSVWRDY